MERKIKSFDHKMKHSMEQGDIKISLLQENEENMKNEIKRQKDKNNRFAREAREDAGVIEKSNGYYDATAATGIRKVSKRQPVHKMNWIPLPRR